MSGVGGQVNFFVGSTGLGQLYRIWEQVPPSLHISLFLLELTFHASHDTLQSPKEPPDRDGDQGQDRSRLDPSAPLCLSGDVRVFRSFHVLVSIWNLCDVMFVPDLRGLAEESL